MYNVILLSSRQAVVAAAVAAAEKSVKNELEIGEKLVQMEMNTHTCTHLTIECLFFSLYSLNLFLLLPVLQQLLLLLLCSTMPDRPRAHRFYSSLIDQYRTFLA